MGRVEGNVIERASVTRYCNSNTE